MKTFQLALQTVLKLNDGQAAVITCTRGMVWLTESGKDIVLKCGERYQLHGKDMAVIEPLAHSTITVEHPTLLKRPSAFNGIPSPRTE
ncbi:hypothetical protein HNQ59_001158 [Chitinivorax tropicus]|uniref:DUF2917 domain-containing protein n=1 Tax=Chitinivorax tropicus TaxID=714531 RepID=A0A840MGW3_9PROT|nr:DUF2917 domain-containing protein [Chitinivorax tropicus]MBB5017888.1 hypothetical protein [Chitinivorax tropicus]